MYNLKCMLQCFVFPSRILLFSIKKVENTIKGTQICLLYLSHWYCLIDSCNSNLSILIFLSACMFWQKNKLHQKLKMFNVCYQYREKFRKIYAIYNTCLGSYKWCETWSLGTEVTNLPFVKVRNNVEWKSISGMILSFIYIYIYIYIYIHTHTRTYTCTWGFLCGKTRCWH